MQHGVATRERRIGAIRVAHVAGDDLNARPHAGLDRLQPAFPAARVIEDHGAYLVSGPDQAFDQVGADEAVGAGDQRLHDRPASSMARPRSKSIRGKRRWLLSGQQL